MKSTTKQHPLKRLLSYTRRYRGRVITATVFSILNKIFDIMPPMLIGAAVDVIVRQDDSFLAALGFREIHVQLIVLSILTLIIWVLESLFDYIRTVYWRNLSQLIEHDLRIEAYEQVQKLELAYFEDRSTGGLMSILSI